MKKPFAILLLALICAVSTISCSKNDNKETPQTTYTEEVEKLLEASNSKDMMISLLTNSLKTLFSESEANQIATEVIDEIWPDYINDCCQVYKKYLSLDDIRAVNEFYSTPSGEKFAKNAQNITNEMFNIGATQYSEVIHDVIKKHSARKNYYNY